VAVRASRGEVIKQTPSSALLRVIDADWICYSTNKGTGGLSREGTTSCRRPAGRTAGRHRANPAGVPAGRAERPGDPHHTTTRSAQRVPGDRRPRRLVLKKSSCPTSTPPPGRRPDRHQPAGRTTSWSERCLQRRRRTCCWCRGGQSSVSTCRRRQLLAMGRATSGVFGNAVQHRRRNCCRGVVVPGPLCVLSRTDGGYAKRTAMRKYRLQGRGGKGVTTIPARTASCRWWRTTSSTRR